MILYSPPSLSWSLWFTLLYRYREDTGHWCDRGVLGEAVGGIVEARYIPRRDFFCTSAGLSVCGGIC